MRKFWPPKPAFLFVLIGTVFTFASATPSWAGKDDDLLKDLRTHLSNQQPISPTSDVQKQAAIQAGTAKVQNELFIARLKKEEQSLKGMKDNIKREISFFDRSNLANDKRTAADRIRQDLKAVRTQLELAQARQKELDRRWNVEGRLYREGFVPRNSKSASSAGSPAQSLSASTSQSTSMNTSGSSKESRGTNTDRTSTSSTSTSTSTDDRSSGSLIGTPSTNASVASSSSTGGDPRTLEYEELVKKEGRLRSQIIQLQVERDELNDEAMSLEEACKAGGTCSSQVSDLLQKRNKLNGQIQALLLELTKNNERMTQFHNNQLGMISQFQQEVDAARTTLSSEPTCELGTSARTTAPTSAQTSLTQQLDSIAPILTAAAQKDPSPHTEKAPLIGELEERFADIHSPEGKARRAAAIKDLEDRLAKKGASPQKVDASTNTSDLGANTASTSRSSPSRKKGTASIGTQTDSISTSTQNKNKISIATQTESEEASTNGELEERFAKMGTSQAQKKREQEIRRLEEQLAEKKAQTASVNANPQETKKRAEAIAKLEQSLAQKKSGPSQATEEFEAELKKIRLSLTHVEASSNAGERTQPEELEKFEKQLQELKKQLKHAPEGTFKDKQQKQDQVAEYEKKLRELRAQLKERSEQERQLTEQKRDLKSVPELDKQLAAQRKNLKPVPPLDIELARQKQKLKHVPEMEIDLARQKNGLDHVETKESNSLDVYFPKGQEKESGLTAAMKKAQADVAKARERGLIPRDPSSGDDWEEESSASGSQKKPMVSASQVAQQKENLRQTPKLDVELAKQKQKLKHVPEMEIDLARQKNRLNHVETKESNSLDVYFPKGQEKESAATTAMKKAQAHVAKARERGLIPQDPSSGDDWEEEKPKAPAPQQAPKKPERTEVDHVTALGLARTPTDVHEMRAQAEKERKRISRQNGRDKNRRLNELTAARSYFEQYFKDRESK